MTKERLLEALAPLVEILGEVGLDKPGAARAQLQDRAPVDGPLVAKVRVLAEGGVEAGWLLPRELNGVRFGRLAKDLGGFSVDAVLMTAAGPPHRHPRGEIDLCFAREGSPKFDGSQPGWVVYGPDSQHTPTVKDGEMLILYFLPGGAIDWLPAPAAEA